jgi:diguanylate cyclase (GGDEF)-like protein
MAQKDFDYNRFIDVPGVDDVLWKAGYFCGGFKEGVGILSKPLSDLGFTLEDMLSGSYKDHIHPDDRATYLALWNRVSSGQDDELYCEYRLSDKKKKWNWIETHAVIIERNKDNSVNKVVGTDKNITSRKYAESYIRRELMDTKRKLDLSESIRLMGTHLLSHMELFENHESGLEQLRQIVSFDYCQIISHSERNRDSKNELIISYPEDKTVLNGHDVLLNELMTCHYPSIYDDQKKSTPYSSLLAIPLRFSGRFMGAVLLWHEKEKFYNGRDLYPVKVFADIIAVAVRNSREYVHTRRGMEMDQLTGFLTRKSFMITANDLWKNTKKGSRPFTVAMIDIDHFNKLNDDFGRAAGDRIIGQLSDLCRMKLRSNAVLGRHGGEEFVVIAPDCGELDSLPVFERVRSSCESTSFDGVDRTVTISIGLTICTGRDKPEDVIDRAERAMHKAKTEGRNRIVTLSK